MDWKLFSKCEFCKKRKFFVSKKSIKLPIGGTAKSQKLTCRQCINKLNKAINR